MFKVALIVTVVTCRGLSGNHKILNLLRSEARDNPNIVKHMLCWRVPGACGRRALFAVRVSGIGVYRARDISLQEAKLSLAPLSSSWRTFGTMGETLRRGRGGELNCCTFRASSWHSPSVYLSAKKSVTKAVACSSCEAAYPHLNHLATSWRQTFWL